MKYSVIYHLNKIRCPSALIPLLAFILKIESVFSFSLKPLSFLRNHNASTSYKNISNLIEKKRLHNHYPYRLKQNYVSPLSDDFKAIQQSISPSTSVQLWLDLRNTKFQPCASLTHLSNDLWNEFTPPGEKSVIVDKVIVDVDTLTLSEQELKKNIQKTMKQVYEEFEDSVEVFFITPDKAEENNNYQYFSGDINASNTSTTVSSSSTGKQNPGMIPIGKVLTLRDKNMKNAVFPAASTIHSNPLPAMDIVSKQNWLLIDPQRIHNQQERNDFIQGFLQLLSFSSSASSFTLGLDEPMSGKSDSDQHINRNGGGMAIVCKNNSDILNAGACIQSLTGDNGQYETTQSGILVSSTTENFENVKNMNTNNNSNKNRYSFAIVIPFDATLWKTASYIFSENLEV